MDAISRQRLTGIAVAVLLLVNAATLATMWYVHATGTSIRGGAGHGGGPGYERPDAVVGFLTDELDLTDDQAAAFRDIRERYATRGATMQEQIHRLKRDLVVASITIHPDTAGVRHIASEIGGLQAELELVMYAQFNELYALCKPVQRKRLGTIVHELLELNRPPGPAGERRIRHPQGPPR